MSLEDRRDCSYAAANQEIARIAGYHQKLERGKEGFYTESQRDHGLADILISDV